MKALLITFLIVVTAVLVYDRVLTPPGRRVLFENPPLPVPQAGPASRRGDDDAQTITRPAEGAVFVPPEIEPLESMTKNWRAIPPQAFPRQVRLSKPVSLQMGSGTATLPAGAMAHALAAQENVLLIAPDPESKARGRIFVHDTDLPAQVRASYDQWRRGRMEMALAAWKRRQSEPVTSMPHAVDARGAPKRNADGSYDLLLASLRSGQVTDIKPGKIQRWGAPQQATIDNQPTWTVSVFYEAMVFCGPIDAEAQAQVREGRVVRWIYPGSGEPVP